jgi:hypothetical protein
MKRQADLRRYGNWMAGENPMIGLGRRLLARRARQRSEIDAISR